MSIAFIGLFLDKITVNSDLFSPTVYRKNSEKILFSQNSNILFFDIKYGFVMLRALYESMKKNPWKGSSSGESSRSDSAIPHHPAGAVIENGQ